MRLPVHAFDIEVYIFVISLDENELLYHEVITRSFEYKKLKSLLLVNFFHLS